MNGDLKSPDVIQLKTVCAMRARFLGQRHELPDRQPPMHANDARIAAHAMRRPTPTLRRRRPSAGVQQEPDETGSSGISSSIVARSPFQHRERYPG